MIKNAELLLPWYVSRFSWVFGVIILTMFAFLIGWLVKPSISTVPVNVVKSKIGLNRLLVMQNRRNDSLKLGILKVKEKLESKICIADAVIPQSPKSEVPDNSKLQKKLLGTDLLEKMKKATVLVITKTGSGTGFFITPNRIMTNAHVVDGANAGEVFITSRTLGKKIPVRVLKRDHDEGVGERDYALLEADGVGVVEVLKMYETASVASEVMAVGYPGLSLRLWKNSVANKTIPPLYPSKGIIMFVDEFKKGIAVINHDAEISQGNSGGPLVDLCGRLIGINTFYLAMTHGSGTGKFKVKKQFALGSADIINFLNESGVKAKVSAERCAI